MEDANGDEQGGMLKTVATSQSVNDLSAELSKLKDNLVINTSA